MIRLNVFIQVNESNRNAALETAKELVAQSLNDNGCIAYDVFESATRKDVIRGYPLLNSIKQFRALGLIVPKPGLILSGRKCDANSSSPST